jgi:hypothetical protein
VVERKDMRRVIGQVLALLCDDCTLERKKPVVRSQ